MKNLLRDLYNSGLHTNNFHKVAFWRSFHVARLHSNIRRTFAFEAHSAINIYILVSGSVMFPEALKTCFRKWDISTLSSMESFGNARSLCFIIVSLWEAAANSSKPRQCQNWIIEIFALMTKIFGKSSSIADHLWRKNGWSVINNLSPKYILFSSREL